MRRPFATVQRPSSSSAQGYGAEHRAWRSAILARDPVCRWSGCNAPSAHADHIVPKSQGGAPLALSNGQGLCAQHHSAKTATEIHARRSPKRPAERHPGDLT